jgi:hypothetical protein
VRRCAHVLSSRAPKQQYPPPPQAA